MKSRIELTRMPPTATMPTALPLSVSDVPVRNLVDLRQRCADYLELTKPKIAAMALVTVAVGYWLGAALPFQWNGLLHTMIGAAVVAAGGSVLNHWLEREADARMRRTANRPIVAGRVHPTEAVVFGVTLCLLGVLYLLYSLPNPAAAIAAAATCILYVAVYTPMKRLTAWNTVVGAIPGALPPLIGWCGATGGLAAQGWALFAILFVWQLPHFFSIAFMHRDDYARGGMKMLPVVERADGYWTGQATLWTSVLLIGVTALPFFLNAAGWVYLVGSLPVAVWFTLRCIRFSKNRTATTARTVLRGSLVYLLAVMVLFVADGVIPRYAAVQ